MPLLFAATLFVSASLLFMVQPMVGKLVLPLLGGSPAVWNACMVFFQALLLLGYLYADRLTRQESPRKQWFIHLGVLALPIAAFALAIALSPGDKTRPIAVFESLAPSDGSSAIISVLTILTIAIGIPFFVVSTSATLLQKWFTYTGHPSARDPYFLYAASNFGSLISLLGYPLIIEPSMTQTEQTWFWAAGFVALVALIAFCGRAAVNPLGVPPVPATVGAKASVGQQYGKQFGEHQYISQQSNGQNTRPQSGTQQSGGRTATATAPAPAATAAPAPAEALEAAPSWARMAKWTVLAFVPSSLMLGVTFHMTTDIASIPLLWVGPLALYLLTFIIAFGRVPPWFRVLIGNLAPVMILLLVFLMISDVQPGVGITLLLYNLTFFATALMCHYELARDRPSPQYLTTYFLIMSLGGVLGGIFNSLIAPLVFTLPYEFPLVLILACLMVPKLLPEEDAEDRTTANGKPVKTRLGGRLDEDDYWAVVIGSSVTGVLALFVTLPAYKFVTGLVSTAAVVLTYNVLYLFLWRPFWAWYRTLAPQTRHWIALVLDVVIPVAIGVLCWQMPRILGAGSWYTNWVAGIAELVAKLRIIITENTITVIVLYALPVMVCFFFVDRPLRFALAVAAILGPAKIKSESSETIYTERSFFGILKIQQVSYKQPLLERTRYKLTEQSLEDLRKKKVPEAVLSRLAPLVDKEFRADNLENELTQILSADDKAQFQKLIVQAAAWTVRDPGVVRNAEGKPIVLGEYVYRKLVHGTTLHGTQVWQHDRHICDDFQLLTAGNVWDNIAVAGAQMKFNAREEPLTYYHRTGPVGAMFAELARRNPPQDKDPVAMVGLGTGTVSCYAQKGQKLTFYEIDPAVKRLVADTDQYFSYVTDARARGAEIDFRMGDARLKLKEDTDRKYALLLVDAFSSDSIPIHLLTVEAVQLYMDRLQEDGILGLHISNKYVQLEPVVAAIADHLGLVARVWNDDEGRMHGKTASSWVALARKSKYLGARLCAEPLGDLIGRYGETKQLFDVISDKYPDLQTALQKPVPKFDPKFDPRDFNGPKALEKLNAAQEPERDQKTRLLEWLDKRITDPQAQQFAAWIRLRDSEYTTLMEILHIETGYGFRPVYTLKGVDMWTDDYADVMRVMRIEQLQSVRKFFGLPTPVDH